MNTRTLLSLGIILALWITPGVAQEDNPTGPEPELTDLYPPFDDRLPPNTLDVEVEVRHRLGRSAVSQRKRKSNI